MCLIIAWFSSRTLGYSSYLICNENAQGFVFPRKFLIFCSATKWHQFHATFKCDFHFVPWANDKYTCRYTICKNTHQCCKVTSFPVITINCGVRNTASTLSRAKFRENVPYPEPVYTGWSSVMPLECHWLTQCTLGCHWATQRILTWYTGTPLEKT